MYNDVNPEKMVKENKIMGLFTKKTNGPALSERELLQNKFNGARGNLLLVVIFSLINLGMLVFNSGTYFLFSASVPYFIGDIAMDLCGKYPVEYYESMYDYMPGADEFYGIGVFAVLLAIAVTIIALYLICYIFSKKPRVGFLVFALVLFVIDTAILVLFAGFSADWIIDYVFHAWVIISLISGITAYAKLKKLPAEEESPVIEGDVAAPSDESADETKSTLNGEPIE